eukprot:GHVR01183066.1.p1 GENE.GHVR01183066.1~~GHVR01183066.1.p1  ORF type:complete len:170 (+),score=19.13 GHVR01183066.1:69-512(+)
MARVASNIYCTCTCCDGLANICEFGPAVGNLTSHKSTYIKDSSDCTLSNCSSMFSDACHQVGSRHGRIKLDMEAYFPDGTSEQSSEEYPVSSKTDVFFYVVMFLGIFAWSIVFVGVIAVIYTSNKKQRIRRQPQSVTEGQSNQIDRL